MYEYLRRRYLDGSLTDAALQNAVTKTWISQEQADQIRRDKAIQELPDDALLLADLENATL